MSKAAWLSSIAFSKDELVNYYVKGLRTAVHEIVAHEVRQLPQQKGSSLSAVRQVAEAIEKSKRSLRAESGKCARTGRTSDDEGVRVKRESSKTVVLTPPAPELADDIPW